MSNYYNISCSLDTIQYKLKNVAHTLEIIAEHINEDPNSGAVWCMYDVVSSLASELEVVSSNVLDYHYEEQQPVKKSKKK
jgi:hypothetical protein